MREGWSQRSLGDVATIYNGNSINADEKKKKYLGQTQGLPFIATKDVGNDGVIDYENGVRIPNYTDFKIAHPDSVFVCAEGGSAGKKVAFVEQEVCFGNKLFALQPKKAHLNGRYLYYFVQSQAFKEQFKQLITGIIGGVSSKKFKEIPIILSPLPEQRRIVDILDQEFAKIDALKADTEKSLQAAKDLFQATLKKELEPKDDWKKIKLKDIAIVRVGPFGSSLHKNDYISGGTPLVNPIHMKDGRVVPAIDFSVNQEKLNELQSYVLKEGDVVFARRGEIGRCSLITDKEDGYLCGTGSLFVRFLRRTNSKFMMALFNSPFVREQLLSKATGATMLNINSTSVENLELNMPTDKEQESILSGIDDLNDRCNTLQENYQKTLTLCDDLKQSLLRKAFNGEL